MLSIARKKQGMENQLLIIILILAAAIVIFIVLTKYITSTNANGEIEICKLSVVTQSATEIKPGMTGWKSPLDLNCAKRYINFYDTKVEQGMSPYNTKPLTIDYDGKKVTKFNGLSDMVVDQVVAEELRICKYQFGDGKIDIFPNNEKLFEGQKVCFVCSEINFKPTVQKQIFSNLVDYTKKTTYAKAGKTYYNYLTEKTIYDNPMWDQPTLPGDKPLSNLNFDKSKPYLVFVEKYSRSTVDVLQKEGIWIIIAPASDINNYCDVIAN